MKFKFGCALAALMVGALPMAAHAQASDPAPNAEPAQDGDIPSEDEIVVKGELRGAVPGEIKPELTLNPADIRAYGVSSIAELVDALAPQTRSGRGRGGDGPVILLNGRRISNFSELRDLPPEAIERTEILPEEAALKYGYRADQRVVNIVLRPRFRAITAELTAGSPTAGGYSTVRAEGGLVRINRNGRINVNLQYDGTTRLTESERDITSTVTPSLFDFRGNVSGAVANGEIDPALSAIAGSTTTIAGVPASAASGAPSLANFGTTAGTRNTTDLTPYRTLVSPSDRLAINAVISRNVSSKVSASFNARLEATNRESWLGLGGLTMNLPDGNPFSPFTRDVTLSRYLPGSAPLSRTVQGRTAHVGFSVNGDAKTWRWSVTGNYDRVTSSSVTDTGFDTAAIQARLDANDPAFNPFGTIPLGLIGVRPADIAKSTSSVASIDALVSGPIAKVPAGEIRTSLRVTGRTTDYDSNSLRSGTLRSSSVARDLGSAQLNVDLPLTSRRRAVLDALGDISINGNVEIEQLSDFGTLVTTGYGLVWAPVPQLRLIGSVTDEEGAPSAQQLGDPRIDTPNVRVFDYVRGESVDITSISGGNPGLTADSRNVFKIGGNLTPFEKVQFNLNVEYVRSTTRNQITAFPAATAEIEAAFPGRFTRDVSGRLISIDTRAVNFASAEREELRWGFNLSLPLSSSIEKQMAERRAERERQRAEAERNGTPLPPEGPQRP
ncbi:TonB-dependent receptor plug domain-containing protein, partial [Sphingomonas sp. AOB5]|uniref:TonB-dependent receptor plug domain-containing protein n=1 Tax=Sphingomonas sp. AOB5 TaxID=3034017 RepID=UPI0023F763EE